MSTNTGLPTATPRQPIASAPSIPAPEPGPVADRVFVSPRVVDRGAFDELSTALRALIDRAAEQGVALTTAASAAAAAARLFAEGPGGKGVEARVAQAADAVAGLEARLAESRARLDHVLTQCDRANTAEGQLADRIDSLVAERSAAVESRAHAAFERLESRAAGLAESVGARLGQIEHAAEQRAAALESRLASITEQVGRLNDAELSRLTDAAARIESARSHAQDALAALDAPLRQSTADVARLAEQQQQVRSQVDAAAASCAAAKQEAAQITRTLADAAERAGATLAALRALSERDAEVRASAGQTRALQHNVAAALQAARTELDELNRTIDAARGRIAGPIRPTPASAAAPAPASAVPLTPPAAAPPPTPPPNTDGPPGPWPTPGYGPALQPWPNAYPYAPPAHPAPWPGWAWR